MTSTSTAATAGASNTSSQNMIPTELHQNAPAKTSYNNNSQQPKLPYRSIISPRSSSMSRGKINTFAAPSQHQHSNGTMQSGSMFGGDKKTAYANVIAYPAYSSVGVIGAGSFPFSIIPPTRSISGTSLREFREKEKRELVELNDRFANYVERVRFLESQNKQLKAESDALKRQLGSDGGRIKELYEAELKQARDVIASTGKDYLVMEARALKAEDDAKFYRSRYDDLFSNQKHEQEKLRKMANEMSENQAAMGLMNRRMQDLDDELQHYKQEAQKLLSEVQRLSSELCAEMETRLQLENQKQSLEEELNFLKQVHAEELEDLRQRNGFGSDPSIDPAVFFRHELSNAIKDIRAEYDALHQQQRGEMENWYRLKVTNAIQELQSKRMQEHGLRGSPKQRDDEIKKLYDQVTGFRRENTVYKQKLHEQQCAIEELQSLMRNERDSRNVDLRNRDEEIADLKNKLSDLIAEYEDLASNNNNLNTEISIYRKLLEGSENNDGLRQIAEEIEKQAQNDWSKKGAAALFAPADAGLTTHGKPIDSLKSRVVTFRTELTSSDETDEAIHAARPSFFPKVEYGYITKEQYQSSQPSQMTFTDDINGQTEVVESDDLQVTELTPETNVMQDVIPPAPPTSSPPVEPRLPEVICDIESVNERQAKTTSTTSSSDMSIAIAHTDLSSIDESGSVEMDGALPQSIGRYDTQVDGEAIDSGDRMVDDDATKTDEAAALGVIRSLLVPRNSSFVDEESKSDEDDQVIVESNKNGQIVIENERVPAASFQLIVDISYEHSSRSLAFVLKRAGSVDLVLPPPGNLFIRCTLMPEHLKQRSHSVPSCREPVWNTLFEYDVPSLNACYSKTVYFALKLCPSTSAGDPAESNKVMTLGRAKLCLSDVNLDKGEQNYSLLLNVPDLATRDVFTDSSSATENPSQSSDQ